MTPKVPNQRLLLILALLLVVVLITGCGAAAEEDVAKPLLPRLEVSFDDQGFPTVLGIPLGMVSNLVGMDISGITLPAELVQQLQDANIQHIELVMTEPALYFFVNGQPLPYLSMDEESWETLGQVAELLGVPVWDTIQTVRENFLSRIGVQLALKFPLQPGAAEIPLREEGQIVEVDVDEARAAAGTPALAFQTAISADADGNLTVAGVPLKNLQLALALAGVPVELTGVSLNPDTIATITAANVQHFQAETEPEGLYLYVNGQELPRLTWDEERLSNLVALVKALEPDDSDQHWIDMLAPLLLESDIEIALFLPRPAGVTETPPSPYIDSR